MSKLVDIEVLVQEYARWIEDHIDRGWNPYLLSFMFTPLAGSERAIAQQMERAITAEYSSTLTRVVRNPRSSPDLPVWVCCSDHLVYKREKITLKDATVNGGLHAHALAIIPPENRLRTNYADLIMGHRLTGRMEALQRIHVEPITETPDRVVDYAFKNLKRRRISFDDILILPRSRNEL